MAIKANRALRKVPVKQPSVRRALEPVTIGMIGEVAVKLGFQGVPSASAMQQISRTIPQVNVNEYLQAIASESLKGVEKIREKLAEEYGEITIIGRGEGRHPDLAGKARPDFVAFHGRDRNPVIVEVKDTMTVNKPDEFQAAYYNGIAERYGLYLMEERLEGKTPVFFPQTIRGGGEAVLIYPRLAKYSIVKERFVPEDSTIKGVWKAKELGFKGLMPETDCEPKCAHNRLKSKLQEGDMEPLQPPPLTFSKGVLESGFDLDIGYQATYAWNLLPPQAKLAILFSARRTTNGLVELKEWLTEKAGLDEEAAEIVMAPDKRETFLASRPDAQAIMKSMDSELESWRMILKERLEVSAPSILAIATAVYSLPKRSSKFVQDAWDRWR